MGEMKYEVPVKVHEASTGPGTVAGWVGRSVEKA